MKKPQTKDTFFEESAAIFKVLSSPIRLKLINYISYCPRTVEDCSIKLNQSIQNVSLHLQSLSKVGILKVEKLKNFRIYSLAQEQVLEVLSSKLIAGPRSLLPPDKLWDSSLEDLADAIIDNKTRLIDLRDPVETVSIPVKYAIEFDPENSDLKAFLQKLPYDNEIVFFCRGRWCEKMADTVKAASRFRPHIKGADLTSLQLQLLNRMFR